jgi:hypothetical protein
MVTVDSRPEAGSTFTVELPRRRPAGAGSLAATAASARADIHHGPN